MHYLDNSATTRVLDSAAEIAVKTMCEGFGNPSSVHKMGIKASEILENSRRTVAQALNADPTEVFFTSGGTESINTAVFGACRKNFRMGKHIITTAVEHSATLESVKKLVSEGFEVTYLKPDKSGRISIADFEAALREDTIFCSCMLVNNETGALMPVAEIGRLLKKKNPKALFHVDAVQGFFRLPIEPKAWNADFISVSGHKIGAPKGIGALYIKKGVKIPPLVYGGGQEKGMRPGTEPLPNIAAFAEACSVRSQHFDEDFAHVEALKADFVRKLKDKFPWVEINGEADIPHVLNVSFVGCKSEVMLRVLEMDDVYVSSGSACSKGKASHVLTAMGLSPKTIDSALRISFAPFNTTADSDAFMIAAEKGVKMLKR